MSQLRILIYNDYSVGVRNGHRQYSVLRIRSATGAWIRSTAIVRSGCWRSSSWILTASATRKASRIAAAIMDLPAGSGQMQPPRGPARATSTAAAGDPLPGSSPCRQPGKHPETLYTNQIFHPQATITPFLEV